LLKHETIESWAQNTMFSEKFPPGEKI